MKNAAAIMTIMKSHHIEPGNNTASTHVGYTSTTRAWPRRQPPRLAGAVVPLTSLNFLATRRQTNVVFPR